MASTWEPTRAAIVAQSHKTGVVRYAGEEAYSAAKGSGGVLKDTNFGKWINTNFPNGAEVHYQHQDDIDVVTITSTAAGVTTIESVGVTK